MVCAGDAAGARAAAAFRLAWRDSAGALNEAEGPNCINSMGVALRAAPIDTVQKPALGIFLSPTSAQSKQLNARMSITEMPDKRCEDHQLFSVRLKKKALRERSEDVLIRLWLFYWIYPVLQVQPNTRSLGAHNTYIPGCTILLTLVVTRPAQ